MRARSDHEEEPIGVDGLLASVRAITKHEVLQPSVAPTADDLGPETDLQLWRRLHLADQVVRHPLAERLSTDHERDAPGVTCEVQRSLSGRVRAPEDVDVLAGHGGRLGSRAAVEDAGAVQRLERRDAESAIAGARRQEHRAARTRPLSERVTKKPSCSRRRSVTLCMNAKFAPKTHACSYAC